jgi:hypothetical protein
MLKGIEGDSDKRAASEFGLDPERRDRAAKLQTLLHDLLPHIDYANLPQDLQHRIGEVFVGDGREDRGRSEMGRPPERIGAYITEYTSQEWYELFYDEPVGDGDTEYIRADIAKRERTQAIETEAAVWLKGVNELLEKQATLVGQAAEAERLNALLTSLQAHLGRIIVDIPAREVDAAQARDEALREILKWVPECTCDGAYLSRGLIAPDCQYHSSGMEEVEEIVRGLFGRRGKRQE